MNFHANFGRRWRSLLQEREEKLTHLLLQPDILILPPGVRIHPDPPLTAATTATRGVSDLAAAAGILAEASRVREAMRRSELLLLREISLVSVGGDSGTVAGIPLVRRPPGFPRRRRVLLGGPPDYRVVGRFTP